MAGKSAKRLVQDVYSQLYTAKNSLSEALNSVEKPGNRQHIQSTLNAVDNALETASNALVNYKD